MLVGFRVFLYIVVYSPTLSPVQELLTTTAILGGGSTSPVKGGDKKTVDCSAEVVTTTVKLGAGSTSPGPSSIDKRIQWFSL